MKINELEPLDVMKYFAEICEIPHGSGNVKQISDYCVQFAKNHNLKFRQDESYNVIIWKDATKGHESSDPIILQGHIDMVAVKDEDCTKDLENDGLDVYVDGDFITAEGTTLGGDDGIAIAYSLAILASDNYEHPAIEAVFTVDEEVGMLGAAALDMSDIKGHTMLNMDSEEEGVFLAGCAGGATVYCNLPVSRKTFTGQRAEITIRGLVGGHSGTDIIFQRANANVLMGRLLNTISGEMIYGIKSIVGGEKDNAIAISCTTELIVGEEEIEQLKDIVNKFNFVLKSEYALTDPDINVMLNISDISDDVQCYNQSSVTRLVMALMHLPYGVQKMSNDIKGLVQTSLNLGIIREECNDESQEIVSLCYSVRSSVKSEKDFLTEKLINFTEFIGGECEIKGSYPAWEFKAESKLRDIMCETYKKMYHKDSVVETMHAGVECGIISEKIDGLDCVSFGPDIIDIHTTKEKLSISSVQRTWKLILEVIKQL